MGELPAHITLTIRSPSTRLPLVQFASDASGQLVVLGEGGSAVVFRGRLGVADVAVKVSRTTHSRGWQSGWAGLGGKVRLGRLTVILGALRWRWVKVRGQAVGCMLGWGGVGGGAMGVSLDC